MRVAVAGDHAGFALKKLLAEQLSQEGYEVTDLGAFNEERSDYPDFARAVGEALQQNQVDRGIVICGSGIGACIASNKMHGIRGGICHDTYSAHQGVEHDDMNVLCLGARIIGPELAPELVRAFLGAQFLNREPYTRRVGKINAIEATGGK